jgi:hypothetical protein
MAEMNDVLAELRHRIMGPIEGGPSKPVPEPVEAVTPLPACGVLHPAMSQPANIEHQHGSAAVALRRLAHPRRDGGVVVEDDPISPLIRRLSRDMPELIEEVLAFIERRIAEMNGDDGAAPRPTADSVALVKPEVVARFAAMANAERMGFGEFLEHILDVYEESGKRPMTDRTGGASRIISSEWQTSGASP